MNFWSKLSPIDYIVFTSLLFILLVIIFKTRIQSIKQASSVINYIVMGRRLSLPLFIATLVVSWYGGIFGTTQIAFEHGIYNFITQGVFWYISYIIFALFFAAKIHESNALTLPQLIYNNYGSQSAKFAAYLLLFKSLPIVYSMSIGILIKMIFNTPLDYSIVLGTSLVTCYTCFSNFKSIVYIDVFQFTLMYIAVILVVVFSIKTLGSPEILFDKLPAYYFEVNGKHNASTTLLWLFIALSTTLLSPAFYQRCVAANSIKTMRLGILLSTVLWMIFDLCVTVGALYAKAHLPHADSTYAYMIYGLDILPNGLKGLFLIGMIAIILSTLDAFMFAASTLISHDLINKKYRNSSKIRIISVILVGVLSMILALYFEGNIEHVWIITEGYFGAILIIPFIWIYFIKTRISDRQFLYISITSLLVMLIKDIFFKHVYIETFYLGSMITFSCYTFISIYNKINDI